MGVGALLFLLVSQVLVVVATRCMCCERALSPGHSRALAVFLFVTCCPRLQPLVDYLIVLGDILEKQNYSGKSGLARRLKKLLVGLNEYNRARHISRTFNLKQAL